VAADSRGRQDLRIFPAVLFLVQQHEVRRQLDDARDLRVLGAANLLHRIDKPLRMHAELRAPDQLVADTEVEHELRETRAKRDDAHQDVLRTAGCGR
jgi:hypothetical protein